MALLSPVIYGRGHAVVGAIDCGPTSMRLRLDFGSPDIIPLTQCVPTFRPIFTTWRHTHTCIIMCGRIHLVSDVGLNVGIHRFV